MSVLRLFLVSCCVLASAPHFEMARAAPQSDPGQHLPYGSPDQAGTLAWKAKQAKEGQRHVVVLGTPIEPPLIGVNLASVARRYTVVVAKIVSVKSFPDTPYHIATWYKLRVSEVVSRGPTDPRVLPLEKIPAAPYAEPLLPIRDAELLLLFGGGLLVIDGVAVTAGSPFATLGANDSLLLFLGLDATGKLAKMPLGIQGAFKVDSNQRFSPIDPTAPTDGDFLKELMHVSRGNLAELRSYLHRVTPYDQ